MDRNTLESVMPAVATTHPFWDLVDAALVLNLDHRPERWERLRAQARGLVPEGKLHRVPAVLGRALPGFGRKPWFRGRKRDATWAARGGCVLAHRRALQLARDKGWERVLILEDDIEFCPDFAVVAERLGSSLASAPAGWDVCYLGYTDPAGPARLVAALGSERQLAEVYGCNCAHAYLISAKARDWLLARLPDDDTIWPWLAGRRAVDRWYRRVVGSRFRVLAVSPSMINQAAGFSDIVGRETNYHTGAGHRLSVAAPLGRTGFFFCRAARRAANRALAFYDAARGFAKSLRGF